MSDPTRGNGLPSDGAGDTGILAALPRTRPQRASPRRAAAAKRREAAGTRPVASAGTKPRASGPRKRPAAKPKATSTTKTDKTTKTGAANGASKATAGTRPRLRATRPASRPQERAPRQGYEPEDEVELGATVHPPSGAELVESVADIFGELAGAGLTAGGRLLKDALSLLRLP